MYGNDNISNPLRFKRVLLKLSGEALMGERGFGISHEVIGRIAQEIAYAVRTGAEIGLVVGGGNIFRGVMGEGIGVDRVRGDHIGMLATVINSLMLQDALIQKGIDAKVMSSIEMGAIAPLFSRDIAISDLKNGKVVIFAAGTGNPYFTTDTTAALRALEIRADCLLKATKVNGVYDRDPEQYPDATRFDSLSYDEAIQKGLKVMDLSAILMCKDAGLPLFVFSMKEDGGIIKAISGQETFEGFGTIIS